MVEKQKVIGMCKKIFWCKNCLNMSTRPRIKFDDRGWCNACQWMEETTFTDPTLAAYVKENYIALQVDIDDFDGYALKQKYNIHVLPSLLVFNSSGLLLGQYQESLSPSNMLALLKQYDQPINRMAARPSRATTAKVTTRKQLAPKIKKSHSQVLTSVNRELIAQEEIKLPSTFIVNQPATNRIDYKSNRPTAIGNISRNRFTRKSSTRNKEKMFKLIV